MDLERLLNIVHYSLYRWDYRFHLLFREINPARLIHELPFQKALYKRRGIDVDKEINEVFRRPDIGISVIRSGGVFGALMFFACLSVVNAIWRLAQVNTMLPVYHFVVSMIAGFLIAHFFVYRQDKYLKYFKKFERWPTSERRKWYLVSLLLIIAILLFCLATFLI